jgi:hypothetical protein
VLSFDCGTFRSGTIRLRASITANLTAINSELPPPPDAQKQTRPHLPARRAHLFDVDKNHTTFDQKRPAEFADQSANAAPPLFAQEAAAGTGEEKFLYANCVGGAADSAAAMSATIA